MNFHGPAPYQSQDKKIWATSKMVPTLAILTVKMNYSFVPAYQTTCVHEASVKKILILKNPLNPWGLLRKLAPRPIDARSEAWTNILHLTMLSLVLENTYASIFTRWRGFQLYTGHSFSPGAGNSPPIANWIFRNDVLLNPLSNFVRGQRHHTSSANSYTRWASVRWGQRSNSSEHSG